MSITRMRKHFAGPLGRWILYAIVAVFTVGIVWYVFNPRGSPTPESKKEKEAGGAPEFVGTVNGRNIPRAPFEAAFEASLNQMTLFPMPGRNLLEGMWLLRWSALSQAASELVLAAEAKNKGLAVTDRELRDKLLESARTVVESYKRQYPGDWQTRLARILQQEGETRNRVNERGFTRWQINKAMQDPDHREDLRRRLLVNKLAQLIIGKVPAEKTSKPEVLAPWNKYLEETRKKMKVRATDPELLGYQARLQGQSEQALTQLTKALEYSSHLPGPVEAGIHWMMGSIYREQNKLKSARSSFEQCWDALHREQEDGSRPLAGTEEQVALLLGDLERKLSRPEEAKEWYEAATLSEDRGAHARLEKAYEEMKEPELAAEQKTWMQDYDRRLAEEQQRTKEAQEKAQAEKKKQEGKPGPEAPKTPVPKPAPG
jgi:hypothetical protein